MVLSFFLFIIPILQDPSQVSFLYFSFFGHSALRASLPVCCKFLLHLKCVCLCRFAIDETLGLAFAL